MCALDFISAFSDLITSQCLPIKMEGILKHHFNKSIF